MAGREKKQAAENDTPTVATLTFETALGELEAIVQKLERGQLDLESSISAYERGMELRRWCDDKLAEARMRVKKLAFAHDGSESGRETFEAS